MSEIRQYVLDIDGLEETVLTDRQTDGQTDRRRCHKRSLRAKKF